jgi:hypothetical protein
MSASSAYVIADLLLTLVSVGVRVEAIRGELNALKSAGKTDDEIGRYLRDMAAKAVADAQAAVK